MSPKEKANYIVKKMYTHTGWLAETKEGFNRQDIECALICVDEIVNNIEINLYSKVYKNSVLDENLEYWNEVKEELVKLR